MSIYRLQVYLYECDACSLSAYSPENRSSGSSAFPNASVCPETRTIWNIYYKPTGNKTDPNVYIMNPKDIRVYTETGEIVGVCDHSRD